MNFYDKLNGAIAQNQSLLFIGLDPHPEMLPERYSQKSHPNTMRRC
jgi:uridine monophosphate synthetase